jgi:pimeloyl-ACP methyl ester carboxylesterase
MTDVTAAGGNRLACEIVGDNDIDLLLLHGITESRRTWDPLLSGLSRTFRVINVDLPGHGESEPVDNYGLDRLAADVAAVTDELGYETPLVVGHSLGGFVASVYAAQRPVRGVVNVDQPLTLAAFKDQLTAAEPMLRGEAFSGVIGAMFDGFMAPLPGEEKARLTALRSPNQDAVLGVWDPVFAKTPEELDAMVRSLLAGLDAPYLALHGTDLGPDYVAWLQSVIPQATYEVWPDCGHYPHLMHPTRFVELITSMA